ncbi:phosphatidylinositol 4-kinase gamma 3-like [Dorcoceras hygrometricum]|uniref:Phosphatidylinositol 4-kinase gamma 3-like n=1 Tax=Dorcoceras hygrometricum TaxID=472368 RepID=A0A2Z7BZX5_9LAMI|nr:phosphatidylinositol 4-kinase gamma 3-like [Dorcoceras hygrometricum]
MVQVRQIWGIRVAGAEPAVVIVFINGQRFRVLDVDFDILTNRTSKHTEVPDEKKRYPRWLRANQLGEEKTGREIWSRWMLMRDMTQESVIVNKVYTYDDVKTEDSFSEEATCWEGNQKALKNTLQFVYESSELNLLSLPFFRNGKDPLEDNDYSGSSCNPIRHPSAARTPRTYAHQLASRVSNNNSVTPQ